MGQMISDVETVLNYRNAKKEAQNERQKILADMQQTTINKNNQVRKAIAAQRAKSGAGGGGGGLSKDAVLARIKDETELPFHEKLRNAEQRLGRVKRPSRFPLIKMGHRQTNGLFGLASATVS